ncbi:hypothetical protein PF010_g14932 [Phytophthora fragariae]|uniref:MULE transposase domain-containing protein n=1 Tax=Phytophthora fragariae TaxID=53985 RepID=A0A6G0KVN6_9STRA|nr:hypothetical protein PF010_g14932 [Phytophthora fragariae]
MTYDIENMIPHTCHLGQEDVQLNDASALINVEDDIREFVDGLADQDIPANQIWMFYAASKFYAASTCVVRGLSRSQVIKRIGNAKADTKMFSLVETPDLAKVKNEIVGFSQFNYAWHDDSRAKQGKSEIERLIGWSHPELRNLLRYDGLHLFVDGTFHCTPKSFHQFVTLMMYDPLTDLFVPVFFTLATNKTTDLYTKMFKCIEFALGKEPNPADVYVVLRRSIISGDATAPVRSNLRFPRSAVLPEPNDIVDSDDDNDDIDAENTGVAEDDDAQLSDDELGMLYDTSFDHEKAMESDAAA